MGAQADPEVYHWSSRSVTGSAGRREASCCHRVASRTLFDNRVLSCKRVMSHLGNSSGHLDPYSSGDASGGRLAGMVVGFPRRRGHRYWGKRPPEESHFSFAFSIIDHISSQVRLAPPSCAAHPVRPFKSFSLQESWSKTRVMD